MTRDEFYGNFLKYRKTKNEIQHGMLQNKYYAKLENYYSNGDSKYFWSADEYKKWFENKKEDLQKNANTYKAQAGREAAIKNSEHNYKKIDAINWLHDYYEKLDERDRQLQGGSAKAAEAEGKKYQKDVIAPKNNYIKNRDYEKNAEADRAAKEKENAEKAAERSKLLKANQQGRENAIKNSETTVSKEEFERRVAKDKEYQDNIKKAEEAERKANNPINKFRKAVIENFDKKIQEKVPLYKTMRKLQSESKKVKEYAEQNKAELEKELPDVKKQQLDELNSNSHDFDRFLRKIADDDDYRPDKSLQKTPLYKSLEQYLKEENDDFVSIVDNFNNDGSLSVKDIKEAYNKLTRALEDKIDNMTVEDLARQKIKGV